MTFQELGLPVFSRGVNVKFATKANGGYINHPIAVCGVEVRPGDIVFGDNDAVVVVPREDVLLKRILAGEGTTYDLLFQENYEALGLSEGER